MTVETILSIAGPVSGALLSFVGVRVNQSLRRVAEQRANHEIAVEKRFERLATLVNETQARFTEAQSQTAVAMAEFSAGLSHLAQTVDKAATAAAEERREIFGRIGLLEQATARQGALLGGLVEQGQVCQAGLNVSRPGPPIT